MITGTCIDARDGKVYKTVLMPDGKWWAAENLAWTGAGVDYGNNPANRAIYGRLYVWAEANASCPSGTHLPTDAEWTAMEDACGTPATLGTRLKATTLWVGGVPGTDQYGFRALPGGYLIGLDSVDLGAYCFWWTSTPFGGTASRYRTIYNLSQEVYRGHNVNSLGYSVRFIVDSGNVPDFQWKVFSFDPNWDRTVKESIEYRTQTMTARTGMEQRYRLRHNPRRSLSFDLLNIGRDEVQRFASLVWDSQSDLFAVPWWPDKIQFTGTLASGATVVTIATANRLFSLSPMAVIWESLTKCEAVTISARTGSDITISATMQAYTDPLILPAFPGRLDTSLDASVLALRGSSASVRLSCEVGATDPRPSPSAPAQAYGFDVLTVEPNADGQRWGASRIIDRLDNGFGKVAVVDRGGVSFQSSDFNWFVNGRTEAQAMRDFVDRRAGKLVPFWVPTWCEDLTLSAQALSSASAVVVSSCGYTSRMYPDLSRRYLALRTPAGEWIYRKVTSASDNGTNETLTLDTAIGTTLPTGTIVSFLTLCRLDSDEVAIDWETPIFGQAVTKFVELPREVPS